MIVAGVDIGNTTTEVLLGEVTPDRVRPLVARRARTRGVKGSDDSAAAAGRLVMTAERALGRRAELLLLPPLHPVVTLSAALPAPPGGAPVLRRLDAAAHTPAGRGFAAGAHVPLAGLAGADGRDPVIVSVPAGADFEEAAEIAAAQQDGVPVAGAVVAGDDAVLIGNRIALSIPLVDEADVSGLRPGEPLAVEVAEPGGRLAVLSDPVALVAAFGLEPGRAAALSGLALGLADERCAALALAGEAPSPAERDEAGWLSYEAEGLVHFAPLSRRLLDVGDSIPPGSVREVHAPAGSALWSALDGRRHVRDLFAVDLPAIRDRFLPRAGSIDLAEVPVSAMLASGPPLSSPEEVLAATTGREVVVVPSEVEAAAAGALSTPGAPSDAAVCDVGGGTIDLVAGARRLTAAGAGELLTLAVARALDLGWRHAEQVKRHPSLRVEGPRTVQYEDGSRDFPGADLPPESFGSLCYLRGRRPVPFSDRLAPQEWRPLRLAIKRYVIAANVARLRRWLGDSPRTLLLSGGGALDTESVRLVGEAMRAEGVTVGRANVGGAYGPRYGVALGLLMVHQKGERRAARPAEAS